MKLVNLTPHEVVIYNEAGTEKVLSLPSVGNTRVGEKSSIAGSINGVPVVEKSYTSVDGLPEAIEGTIYIVSLIALNAAKAAGRTDVLCPDSGPESVVRDAQGKILGVRRLQK